MFGHIARRNREGKAGTKAGKKKRSDPWPDIRDYLSGQSPDALIELLLEVAQRDDRLYLE